MKGLITRQNRIKTICLLFTIFPLRTRICLRRICPSRSAWKNRSFCLGDPEVGLCSPTDSRSSRLFSAFPFLDHSRSSRKNGFGPAQSSMAQPPVTLARSSLHLSLVENLYREKAIGTPMRNMCTRMPWIRARS